MTEYEYINTTNLAKVRIALRVTSDIIPADPRDKEVVITVTRALQIMQDRLEAIVTCEAEDE